MRIISKQKGTILIITSLALMVLLILGAYFLSFVVTESRISKSQIIATQTYYLAEAGINEAIWRLKNDPEWIEDFETEPTCENWSASFSRNDILFPDSSYSVQIQNYECARGQIISASTIKLARDKGSQRVVKIKVFKAFGSLTEDSPFFTGGTSENIDISASVLNVFDGNIFSNNNINIKHYSEVNVFDDPETEKEEGKVFVGNNVNLSWSSQINATAICSKNICQGDCADKGCPSGSVPMPRVDFYEGENSYKSKALSAEENGLCSILCNGIECSKKCVLKGEEFDDLLWQVGYGGILTLNNEITYIEDSFELRGGRELIVNGALLADRTIDIGTRFCWGFHCGFNQLIINNQGEGKPSGILTKKNMNFGLYSSFKDVDIVGLVYSSDEIRLTGYPGNFRIIGGMLARKISITSLWSGLDIFLDNSIILSGIWAGPKPAEEDKPPYSPIVTVEHWEESY